MGGQTIMNSWDDLGGYQNGFYSERAGAWVEYMRASLADHAARKGSVWVDSGDYSFTISCAGSSHTARIRLVHDGLAYAEMSGGGTLVRCDDYHDLPEFLELMEEQIDASINYVLGTFRSGQGRWREWIELSYVDYRGHHMRERVCRPRTRLQRLVPRSIVVVDDDGK